MAFTLKEMLAPKGSKCRPGYSLTPKYITIHNTGNASKTAGAENHGKYLQGSGAAYSVSWHYCIDDKFCVQSIPDNENAWHAGDGSNGIGNRKSIAIEICENPDSNILIATNNAAILTAQLMKKYNIPIGNIVQHNYWSGKDCPHQLRNNNPYSWGKFISTVSEEYKKLTEEKPATVIKYTVQVGAFSQRQNAVNLCNKVKAAGFDAFIKEV